MAQRDYKKSSKEEEERGEGREGVKGVEEGEEEDDEEEEDVSGISKRVEDLMHSNRDQIQNSTSCSSRTNPHYRSHNCDYQSQHCSCGIHQHDYKEVSDSRKAYYLCSTDR